MRKLFICFIISMFAFVANAQKHVTFMGIALNGTITAFQQKLAAKNVLPDKQFNATSPVGSRAFNGSFSGYKATIHVYYNEKSKNVYRAKACINNSDEDYIKQRLTEFQAMLMEKYNTENYSVDEQDGYPTFAIAVYDGNDETKDLLGEIDLYISKYELYYGTYQYTLHVDYKDYANQNKNKAEKMSDL